MILVPQLLQMVNTVIQLQFLTLQVRGKMA